MMARQRKVGGLARRLPPRLPTVMETGFASRRPRRWPTSRAGGPPGSRWSIAHQSLATAFVRTRSQELPWRCTSNSGDRLPLSPGRGRCRRRALREHTGEFPDPALAFLRRGADRAGPRPIRQPVGIGETNRLDDSGAHQTGEIVLQGAIAEVDEVRGGRLTGAL